MAKEKMTNLQRRNFDFVKKYLREQVAARRIADFVSFEEKKDEETDTGYTLNSMVDCGGYKALLIYDAMDSKLVDVTFEIVYENCEHHFSIDDIFNLFDVMDFKAYCYFDCFDQASVKRAVDNILDVIQKYHYELKKAGEADNLKRLCEMFEEDQKIADSASVKLRDILREVKLRERLTKTKSDKDRAKLIKELEKREKKGLLITADKRYLAYLRAGYEIEADVDVTDRYEKLYWKYSRTVYGVIFLISIALTLAVYLINHMLVFKGCMVYTPTYTYIFLAVSAVFLWYTVSAFFARKIIVKLCPEEAKEYVKIKIENNYDENKIKRFGQKTAGPVCGMFAFLIFIAFAVSNIGFSDDCVIVNHSLGLSEAVEYEAVTVYRVEQYYDSDSEQYTDYEHPYYELIYGDSCVPVGKIKDAEFNSKLLALLEAHDVNIASVQNEDALSEKYTMQ
ncbi:MAG: hypothetical protein NC397_01830 [Clostridium sp.]|nr:hypothetical protein [Clostridium sp.]